MLERTYIAGNMASLLCNCKIISCMPEEISRPKLQSSLVLYTRLLYYVKVDNRSAEP